MTITILKILCFVGIKLFIVLLIAVAVTAVTIFLYFEKDYPQLEKMKKTQIRYPPYILFDKQVREFKTDNQHAAKILSKCGINEHCTVEEIQDLARNETSQIVLTTIDDITLAYQEVGIFCHDQAHHLGEFLYGYSGNLTEALLSASRKCGGGLYHGILENYFNTKLFTNTNPDLIRINDACKILEKSPYMHIKYECAHGIGHGLTIAYNYDVFQAVMRCDELETDFDQRSCYRGAFMENVFEYLETGKGSFKENSIFFPCTKVNKKYAGDCYHYQALYILDKKAYVLDDAFGECDKIESANLVQYCYYGLGIQISFAYIFDMDKLIESCQIGNPEYHSYCILGAIYPIIDQRGTDQAFILCKRLSEKFKINCYDTLGKWIHTLSPTGTELEVECSKSESENYYQICIKAKPELLEDFNAL